MAMTSLKSDLQSVLAYENVRVLRKFRTKFAVSDDEAQELFTDLKKWLWLCAERKHALMQGLPVDTRPIVIHIGMVIVDELWHTFILHTQDYAEFCERHFGFFVHHSPGSPDFVPMTEEQNSAQLNCIWDRFGEETVIKWYEEYPERYSPENLLKLMKPPVFGRPCEAL